MNDVGNAVIYALEELEGKGASQITSGIKNLESSSTSMIGSLINAVEKINEDNIKYVKEVKIKTGIAGIAFGLLMGAAGGIKLYSMQQKKKEEKSRRIEEAREYLDNLTKENIKVESKTEEKENNPKEE